MNCRDFQEMIDSYLSDELLTETNHDVLRHLENCGNCRNVIEARREVRSRLRSAVINAPQYQIGESFKHNLRTQLKHETFKNQSTETKSWFGLGSWAAVAAGLVLVFTFGFVLLNNSESIDTPQVANAHTTAEFPQNHIVNAAFSDHEYCAIKFDPKNPVSLAKTPEKYKDFEQIALEQVSEILTDYKVKKSHTCKYNDTDFTHVVFSKDNQNVSLMLTNKKDAKSFGKDIAFFSSNKYELARFDVEDTVVFVVSGLDKKINSEVANALYNPMRKHLKGNQFVQTSLLFYY